MTTELAQSSLLASFTCLAERCEDTCCKGWSMQVDARTCAKYKSDAPELIPAVSAFDTPEAHMRRDKQTDFCVKFEDGLCGIHKRYGPEMLGDACALYPRVTRRLKEQTVMTATISCPEIARLALFGAEEGARLEPAFAARIPNAVRDCLPEGISAEQGLAIHDVFMAQTEGRSAEEALICIIGAAHSLSRIAPESWAEAAPFYFRQAANASAESAPADPFNLLHALCGLQVATHLPRRARLDEIIASMEHALGATLNWKDVTITLAEDALPRFHLLRAEWQMQYAKAHEAALSRWLTFQLSSSLFPFAGLGNSPAERIVILGVRFATLKLALMCEAAAQRSALPQETVVRIAQSLARMLDHLGDPAFSLKIYAETGWTQEKRLRSLILL